TPDHRLESAYENDRVEPDGPVPDIVAVEPLHPCCANGAPAGYLPHPGDAGSDAFTQLHHRRVELLDVIIRQWTRADQRHVAAHYVEQLWQFVDGQTPQQATETRYAWIVAKFVECIPFLLQLRVCCEVLLQDILGIGYHSTEFPGFELDA